MVGKKEGREKKLTIDEMTAFCKRKGFVYQSGEIYGGMAGFWDFGPLGVELKNNLKREWWKYHVYQRDDMTGIDGSIITHPKVWEVSGHVSNFLDIFVVCKKCKKPNKVDKNELGKARCPNCGGEFDVATAKGFKLMFKTDIGEKGFGYLRPETAQLIFADFKYVQENARMKLPFGIAQIGKAFRNEIAPRDFLFRCREFEQMEIEYFVDPEEKCPYEIGNSEILVYSAEMQEKNEKAKKMKFKDAFKKGIIKTDWHAYWLEQEFLWFGKLGANPDKFRIRQHLKEEKSHYALDTWDLQYEFPFGWSELQGLANRTDYDLKQHEKFSNTNMSIVNEKNGKAEKILPHVVCEPSQGVERALLVFMFDAYEYDKKRDNIVLKLNPKLAPIKAAILPIVKDEKMIKIAHEIKNKLREEWNVEYDESGSIGRRYSRNDEAGTPLCIAVDQDSVKDKTITIRDRDTTKQVRVKISELKEIVRKVLNGESILKLGKLVETRVK
ncbi:glycine--tRNA ligase [Candidatus Pacearchaeota archaeon]|nr:glycine--tRNA ligase [Candidatus Pacearchaeota archaeon]